MAGRLLREIRKTKPFDSAEQEVFLNIIRTADHLARGFDELLKPFNLSATQYNVLRILRGHSETCTDGEAGAGIPCKLIGEEMITRDPDITRLLDRLETRSLITRQRDSKDRRIVSTRITPDGLKLLKELDRPVMDLHRKQLAHISETKLSTLIDLLELARSPE